MIFHYAQFIFVVNKKKGKTAQQGERQWRDMIKNLLFFCAHENDQRHHEIDDFCFFDSHCSPASRQCNVLQAEENKCATLM